MSESKTTEDTLAGMSHEQMMSALFAQLVMQQANLAMMLLGKAPHPETGQTMRDLESARLFIDQLEMLEAKTKGNLTREEEALLKQSLMTLRLAYVEAVELPEAPVKPELKAETPTQSAPTTPPPAPVAEESHKKFSKRY